MYFLFQMTCVLSSHSLLTQGTCVETNVTDCFSVLHLRKTLRWYESDPMGHNTIGNMMSNLSEKAGLSRRYTNHSLRTTSVHVLDNIGNFASRHIMTVTGHLSENSLKTYTGILVMQ